jgi:hypothetical protein
MELRMESGKQVGCFFAYQPSNKYNKRFVFIQVKLAAQFTLVLPLAGFYIGGIVIFFDQRIGFRVPYLRINAIDDANAFAVLARPLCIPAHLNCTSALPGSSGLR